MSGQKIVKLFFNYRQGVFTPTLEKLTPKNLLVAIVLFIGLLTSAHGQYFTNSENWIDKLNLSGGLPEKLLGTRTAVFYSYTLTPKELQNAHDYFQQTGIDAIAYFDLDMLMAGKDISRAFADYFTKREIANLLFLEKNDNKYRLSITVFNEKENIVDAGQSAFSISNPLHLELLKELYRTASAQQRKLNLLINSLPELDLQIDPIRGKRNEFFAIDVKVDQVAVPMFGDEQKDKILQNIFTENYPLKYKLTEPNLAERELRKQGFLYVVCVVHTRGSLAKELLGYGVGKSETALVSVTYPQDKQQQLKNIPSNSSVYKIYLKHIDSGNVFLGTKWDADLTWEQAMLNHIRGLKAELRTN